MDEDRRIPGLLYLVGLHGRSCLHRYVVVHLRDVPVVPSDLPIRLHSPRELVVVLNIGPFVNYSGLFTRHELRCRSWVDPNIVAEQTEASGYRDRDARLVFLYPPTLSAASSRKHW